MQALPWNVVSNIIDLLAQSVCPVYTFEDLVETSTAFAESQQIARDIVHCYLDYVAPQWKHARPTINRITPCMADQMYNMRNVFDGLVKHDMIYYDAKDVRLAIRRSCKGTHAWFRQAIKEDIPTWMIPHILPVSPTASLETLRNMYNAGKRFMHYMSDSPLVLKRFMQLRRESLDNVDYSMVYNDLNLALDEYGPGARAMKETVCLFMQCDVLSSELRKVDPREFTAGAHRRASMMSNLGTPLDLLPAAVQYVVTGSGADVLEQLNIRERDVLIAYARRHGAHHVLGDPSQYTDDVLEHVVHEAVSTTITHETFMEHDLLADFEMSGPAIRSLVNITDVKTGRSLADLPYQWVVDWLESAVSELDHDDMAAAAREMLDNYTTLADAMKDDGMTLDAMRESITCSEYIRTGNLDCREDLGGDDAVEHVLGFLRIVERARLSTPPDTLSEQQRFDDSELLCLLQKAFTRMGMRVIVTMSIDGIMISDVVDMNTDRKMYDIDMDWVSKWFADSLDKVWSRFMDVDDIAAGVRRIFDNFARLEKAMMDADLSDYVSLGVCCDYVYSAGDGMEDDDELAQVVNAVRKISPIN
jgi:hypothetical protein